MKARGFRTRRRKLNGSRSLRGSTARWKLARFRWPWLVGEGTNFEKEVFGFCKRVRFGFAQGRGNAGDEPPRVCRRLQLLRDWSHDKRIKIPKVFCRGA